jgi:uncharacterized protein YjgD (DUF1641 family)
MSNEISFHCFLEIELAEKRRKEKEEHSVEAYESKFKEIQEISGEQDLKKLVDKFIEGLTCLVFELKTKFTNK